MKSLTIFLQNKVMMKYLLKLRTKLKNAPIKHSTVNQFIQTGIFPQMLKIAKVIPVYKKVTKSYY